MHELIDRDQAFRKPLVAFGRSEDIPAEGDLYGRFLGEWDFEWVDHKDTPKERHVPGEWLFSRIGGGEAVQDLFICPSRRVREEKDYPDTEYGTGIRVYDAERKLWRMTYMQRGLPCHLEGGIDDAGDIVLNMVDARHYRMVWTFDRVVEQSFHWKNEISLDAGATWELIGELFAARRA